MHWKPYLQLFLIFSPGIVEGIVQYFGKYTNSVSCQELDEKIDWRLKIVCVSSMNLESGGE